MGRRDSIVSIVGGGSWGGGVVDRQLYTGIQTDRQTGIQEYRQTDRNTDIQEYRQIDRLTGMQTGWKLQGGKL